MLVWPTAHGVPFPFRALCLILFLSPPPFLLANGTSAFVTTNEMALTNNGTVHVCTSARI